MSTVTCPQCKRTDCELVERRDHPNDVPATIEVYKCPCGCQFLHIVDDVPCLASFRVWPSTVITVLQ